MEICHGAVMGMIKAESMRRAAMSSGSCRVHIIIYIYIYVITHFGSRLKHECVRRNSSSYCALLLDELVRGIAQEQCDIELASVNK
jgi:hypothetical protein